MAVMFSKIKTHKILNHKITQFLQLYTIAHGCLSDS